VYGFFFLESLDSVLRDFRGLFGSANVEDSDDDEVTFESKWSWFLILQSIAEATNRTDKGVLEMGAIEFLNWWAFKKEEADDMKAKMQKGKAK